jgi:serine/threonine protein kinase
VEGTDTPGDLPASSAVRLVDFGGATWRGESTEGSVVCTRQYRPPEVRLGIDKIRGMHASVPFA